MANYSWTYLIIAFGCWDSSEKEDPQAKTDLFEASEKVIFASVEQIGQHSFQANYQQEEYHGEDMRSSHEEVLEIFWQDWDHFQAKRSVDGETVSNVIITDSQTWDWQADKWQKRIDGEPYRVQLRSTWNQWDSVMRHFEEHVAWVFDGEEVIEGRTTRRYKSQFTKPESSKGGLRPLEFQAVVWVDEETAVRILGEVTGILIRDSYKKKIKYQVQRTKIGQLQEINAPR